MTETTTETNPAFEAVTQAFTPVVDAFKSAQDQIKVPEAARDFLKKSAGMAKERAGALHSGVDSVTTTIETAAADAVSGVAKISRSVQQAAYQDAEAFFNAVEKFASAGSFKEAVQVQVDFIRARSETNVARAKSAAEYVSQAFANGAKAAQENFSKVTSAATKAA